MQEMDLVLPKFSTLSLDTLLEKILGTFQVKAENRDIQLLSKTQPGLPAISGDTDSLKRAISALADNAIKFSPRGGRVEINLRHEDKLISLSVKDQGIGISKEVLPHIFERFFHFEQSGDELFGGIGIGLAIARQVVLQHGGRIEVQSEPN